MAEFDIIGVDAVTGKMGKTSTSDTLNINLASLKDVSLTSPQTGDVLVRTENGWSSSSPESLLSSPYTTVYFEDFLYEGTPFGVLPDLILEEPSYGEISFGTTSHLSLDLFGTEPFNTGFVAKVTGNPDDDMILSCAFKHAYNEANMRDFLFGYEALTMFPTISTNRIAITGTLVGSDYTVYADIENATGQHTVPLGVVANTLNTISIEFTTTDVIFKLNSTTVAIAKGHANMGTFVFGFPSLRFQVNSSGASTGTNRVDIDYLKVEKKNG